MNQRVNTDGLIAYVGGEQLSDLADLIIHSPVSDTNGTRHAVTVTVPYQIGVSPGEELVVWKVADHAVLFRGQVNNVNNEFTSGMFMRIDAEAFVQKK